MQVEAAGDISAPDQQDAAGNDNALDQQEAAGNDNAPGKQESARDDEESVVNNLSPVFGDASSLGSEEYNRMMKELEDKEKAEVESTPLKQVLATITGREQGPDPEETPSNAGILGPSNPDTPPRVRPRIAVEPGQGRGLDFGEEMTIEELARAAGQGGIAHSEILTKPITPGEAADPEALEAKRKELLATNEKFANTAVVMLEERQDAKELMELVGDQERRTIEYLQKARALKDRWETIVSDANKEAKRIRQEAIRPRRIDFDSPTNHQPLATPKDNMKKAVELLAKNDEEIDINHLRTLIALAMKQHS
jgi:hypothetical protein